MAEPYDTINALGSGPFHWFRFGDASGSITDEGSAADPIAAQSVGGAFNGTYRYEANPVGDGYGLRFNGQGGFSDSSPDPMGSGARGTMFCLFRTDGVPSSGVYLMGAGAGFDIDYLRIGPNSNNRAYYSIQDGGNDDENWYTDALGLADDAVHSIAVTPPAADGGTPQLYVDGVLQSSLTFTNNGHVATNYWWDSFVEDIWIGHRGGVVSSPCDNIVIYDAIYFNESTPLDDADILAMHIALGGTPGDVFTSKTIRRTGRRTFPDYASI